MDACFSYNCKFGIASVLTEKINIEAGRTLPMVL